MRKPFEWDNYSDQPYALKDKTYKRRHRLKNLPNILWTIFIGVGLFVPFYILRFFTQATSTPPIDSFFGMGVNLDKEKNGINQRDLIDELGIQHVIIRLPLWEMAHLDKYIDFVKRFHDKHIVLNILQSREHIEDSTLLAHDILRVFKHFDSLVDAYQVGNAINRTKWSFFSMGEYLSFYKTVNKVRASMQEYRPLWGPSVIDFEFYYFVHTLFSGVRFDGVSSLLYVDRRGSPYKRQWGLHLKGKIDMLYAMVRFSKSRNAPIYITETNWPIKDTYPFTPTSPTECVDTTTYTRYMKEYFDMAYQSGKITTVYWHQLVAKGYGLIDETTGKKYEAFDTLKSYIQNMKAKL